MLIEESIENVLSPIIKKAFRYATQKTLYKYEQQIAEAISQTDLCCENTQRSCKINQYSATQAEIFVWVLPNDNENTSLAFKLSVFASGNIILLSRVQMSVTHPCTGDVIHFDGGLDSYQGNIDIAEYYGPGNALDTWNRLFVAKQDPAAIYA